MSKEVDHRCDDATMPCEVDHVSFAADIFPIVQDACTGCHNQYVHEGGIELLSYEDIKTVAQDGSPLGTVAAEPGFDVDAVCQ